MQHFYKAENMQDKCKIQNIATDLPSVRMVTENEEKKELEKSQEVMGDTYQTGAYKNEYQSDKNSAPYR